MPEIIVKARSCRKFHVTAPHCENFHTYIAAESTKGRSINLPLYQQLASGIRNMIMSGRLALPPATAPALQKSVVPHYTWISSYRF